MVMGHISDILTFDGGLSKDEIRRACDEWGEYNCDVWEHGGHPVGLPEHINFTNKVFDNLVDAKDYFREREKTVLYLEEAVAYYAYPEREPSRRETDLIRRVAEYCDRVKALEAPHYQGVTQASVKCKKCGAVLPTEYCGRTFSNKCPVCRADLRPKGVLDRKAKYEQKIRELEAEWRREAASQDKKSRAKAKKMWAVHVEQHC